MKNRIWFKYLSLCGLCFLLLSTVLFVNFSPLNFYKANMLSKIQHQPFNGLVYPYQYGVDWVKMSENDRLYAFNDLRQSLLIDPIEYNPFELAIPMESLGFKTESDLRVRNAKITYTVPFLGTYNMDGIEGKGSHPAVDIVLPHGAPLVAIGNGVVVKVDDQEWGFGKHIVLRHNDFPDFEDPSKVATYFSSYSHLDSVQVGVGDVVVKGQVIASMGNSGTATTSHLHFQIDKSSAPWNPYWPFTGQETRDAGLSFTEAVNQGLGRENAKLHTINPMLYVQRYLKYDAGLIASAQTDKFEDSTNTDADFNNGTLDPVVLFSDFTIDTPSVMILGQTYDVLLLNRSPMSSSQHAGLASDFKFQSSLLANYSLPSSLDLSLNQIEIDFVPLELGNLNLSLDMNKNIYRSKNVEVRLLSDLPNNDPDLEYIKRMIDQKIVSGYPDQSFKADWLVNRAEAVKIIYNLLPDELKQNRTKSLNFADVSQNDWFYEYLEVLVYLGAVDADKENFFPGDQVNLAEFLKILYLALQVDLPEQDDELWYRPFIEFANANEILTGVFKLEPASQLKRRDISRIVGKNLEKFR